MLNRKEYDNMEKSCKLGNKILLAQVIIVSLGWWYVIKYIL